MKNHHAIGEFPCAKKLDAAVEELIHALTTDGAHHKQYDIEQALRLICGDDWTNRAKTSFRWKEGVPS